MILEANNIGKTYQSGEEHIRVLDRVSLSVAAGEFVSIQGESGSGKTTFLNIIAGLEVADEGAVRWDGEELAGASLDELARRRRNFLSMVFQSYYLVPEISALDNIVLAGRIAGRVAGRKLDSLALDLLEQVGLAGRGKQMPNTMSGGERQRVAIARALVASPQVILADEPTGNLDEATGDSVMSLLSSLCRDFQTALILVTHNKRHAALADREVHLVNGILNLENGI